MAVEAIFGKPGAGKSYTAVKEKVLPALRKGRKVITNLPLDLEYIRKIWPMMDPNLVEVLEPRSGRLVPFSDPSDFTCEWKHPIEGFGPLYVIDEAHNAFPRKSRGKAHKADEDALLEFFTMHRHTGADIVLCTQQAQQVRADFLGLCQTVIELNNAANIGLGKKRYVKTVRDGMRGTVIDGPAPHQYDTSIFKFYSSYTRGASGEDKKQARSLFLRPFFLLIYAVIFGLFLTFMFANPFRLFAGKPKEEVKNPVEVVEVSAPAPQPAPAVEKVVVSAPEKPLEQRELPAVTSSVPEKPPVAPPPPEEPEEPVYEDGDLTIPNVSDFQMGRLGDTCKFHLIVNGRMTEMWEWATLGWKIDQIANEGADRKKFGSCTLRMVRGEEPFRYQMEFYANKNEHYGPPRRFAARSASAPPPPVESVDVMDSVSNAVAKEISSSIVSSNGVKVESK